MRVQQAIDDHIVGVCRCTQEGAGIVDDARDPLVIVRLLRMIKRAESHDGGIDLNGIHLQCSGAQGRGHVVACSGTDHGHAAWIRSHAVRELIVTCFLDEVREPRLRLEGEVVHALVVVARRPQHHESVFASAALQHLIRRINPLVSDGNGPTEDRDRGERPEHGHDHVPHLRSLEEDEHRKPKREPDNRWRPKVADR